MRTILFSALPRLAARFGQDESGSATVWNLAWLTGFGIMAGLSVDSTNAMRMQTMMQSTSDVAALAAVRDVDDSGKALAEAKYYIELNMAEAQYGELLVDDADVRFGRWNREEGKLYLGDDDPNAVQVTLRRTRDHGNALGTVLLGMTGFTGWDITSTSVALLEWEKCWQDGLIAADRVIMSSDNIFGDAFCVYGRDGITLVNGNDFAGVNHHAYAGYGKGVTHRCGFDLQGRRSDQCDMSSNSGLQDAWFISDDVYPTRLLELDDEGEVVLDDAGNWNVTLDDQIAALEASARAGGIFREDDWRSRKGEMQHAVAEVLQGGGSYYVECDRDNTVMELRKADYRDLLLVTNCLLELPGGSQTNPPIYENITFVSTSSAAFKAGGDPFGSLEPNIWIHGGNQLGTGCSGMTSARFFTMKGIKVDGGNYHKGSQFNAGQSVGIDGGNDAGSTIVHSTSVHTLGDIIMTSDSEYRLCDFTGKSTDIIKVPLLVR